MSPSSLISMETFHQLATHTHLMCEAKGLRRGDILTLSSRLPLHRASSIVRHSLEGKFIFVLQSFSLRAHTQFRLQIDWLQLQINFQVDIKINGNKYYTWRMMTKFSSRSKASGIVYVMRMWEESDANGPMIHFFQFACVGKVSTDAKSLVLS